MNRPGPTSSRAKPFGHPRQRQESRRVDYGQQFDPDSGQVFTETEVFSDRGQYSNWITEHKTPQLVQKVKPNDRGSRSLLDMAIFKTSNELPRMTVDHLATVPWSLAEAVWDQVISSHTETVHAWRLFAANYSSSSEFGQARYRYLVQLRTPTLALQQYMNGLSSPKFKWLTALRISPKQLSVSDLMEISKLQNLAVLDLSDGQYLTDNQTSPFDQRIMRAWAELAAEGTAFQRLKWLLFGWQGNLAAWVFIYTANFPQLKKIVVTDCPQIHQRNKAEWAEVASDHGWEARATKRSARSLRPLLFGSDFHQGAVSGCYFNDDEDLSPSEVYGKTTLPSHRPMIECWMGVPRVWTHIVDDFPGTRTVFLDKVRDIGPRPSRIAPAPGCGGAERPMSTPNFGSTSPPNNGFRIERTSAPRMKRHKQTIAIQDMLAQYN